MASAFINVPLVAKHLSRKTLLSSLIIATVVRAHHEDVAFTLPEFHPASRWMAWMDTSRENGLRPADTHDSGTPYPLQARSMVVLMERRGNGKKEELKEESNESLS
jgi:hypothetical protein